METCLKTEPSPVPLSENLVAVELGLGQTPLGLLQLKVVVDKPFFDFPQALGLAVGGGDEHGCLALLGDLPVLVARQAGPPYSLSLIVSDGHLLLRFGHPSPCQA